MRRLRGSPVARGPVAQSLGLLLGIIVLGQFASGDPYWVGLITTGTILYILAASLNLVFGYAGLFALGQQGLYAVGAYVSVVVGIHVTSLPWIVDVLAGVVGAGLVGFVLALPTARLRAEYLALATIAFGAGIQALLVVWISVTGGPDGLPNVPEASLFGHGVLPGSQEFLWITAVGAALSFLLSAWMISSRLGRSLRALRDNPLASQAVGINPVVTRSIAFAASGAMAGLAGALFAAQQLFIEPDQFDFTLLIGVLVAVLIGGPGRRFGPVIGAIALTALQRATNGLGSMEGVVYAGLLAIIILALPGGVIGAFEKLVARLRTGKPAGGVDAGLATLNGSANGSGGTAVIPVANGGLATVRAEPGAPRRSSPGDRALKIDDVSVQFGGVKAVNEVSLAVNRGEVVGLIGPNGAGKTTLVNIATGVLRPSHGDVLLGDEVLTGLGPHVVSRRGVTRTFQHPQLSPGLSVLDNVMLGLDRASSATLGEALLHMPRSRADERRFRKQVLELLGPVGIAQHANALAGSVPYGVQRRLEVARALACDPEFIFLDEAGAGLSEEERAELIHAIQAVAQSDHGPGIVVIEHNIGFVRQLCARSVVLVGGSVLAAGETDVVLRDERVVDAYLGRPIAEVVATAGESTLG
ncbi:MAG: branched-chain amino acid ABC transporter ATP-binding protein/permease [Solirubrobacteraceae bacterium]